MSIRRVSSGTFVRAIEKRYMATSKKRSKKNSQEALITAYGPLLIEAVGIGLTIVSLAMVFALISYQEPRAGDQSSGNWIGPAGATFVLIILQTVGVVGYGLVFGFFVLSGLIALKLVHIPDRPPLVNVITFGSILSILSGLAIFTQLLASTIKPFGHPIGGAAAVLLGEISKATIGPVGAALLGACACILGIMGTFSISLADLAKNLRAFAAVLPSELPNRVKTLLPAGIKKAETPVVEAPKKSKKKSRTQNPKPTDYQVSEEKNEPEQVEDIEDAAAVLQRVGWKVPVVTYSSQPPAVPNGVHTPENKAQPSVLSEVISERPKPVPPPLPDEGDFTADDEVVIESDGVNVLEEEYASTDINASISDEKQVLETIEQTDSQVEEEESPTQIESESEVVSVDLSAETAETVQVEEVQQEDGPLIHKRREEVDTVDDLDPAEVEVEEEPSPEPIVYTLPPTTLLDHQGSSIDPVDHELLREKANKLEAKLRTYGVEGRVKAIRPGPVVTTYEYQPAPGIKVSKVVGLQDDIAMSMEAMRVRIVAPIPGKGVIGIELPNEVRETVFLNQIIAHERFRNSSSLLTLALGKDVEGDAAVYDLQKMPHLLVAGTTGSGKSVSVNTMIISMLYKATPEQVKFIMVDPKMLELSLYNDIPHLLLPVVTDPQKASLALQWTVDEMERRYQLLSEFKVRDIKSFNKKLERYQLRRESENYESPSRDVVFERLDGKPLPEHMPYIVVLIDEFADLMTVASRDVETSVQRLAQKARAAGIHVLLATQRPSTDVITGVIKNNFPSRIAFRVASRHDSATIINQPGAESLLGRGDSLLLSETAPTPSRIHGSFVSEVEVERVVDFWKSQGRPKYDETILRPRDDSSNSSQIHQDVDEHYDLAVQFVTDSRKASISALQRRLRVGYNRAARMVEMMEQQGIVGPATGPKGEREVLVGSMNLSSSE